MNPDIIAENVAKVHRIIRQREKDRIENEKKRNEIATNVTKTATVHIKDKFGYSGTDRLEEEFKNTTVGLVTKEEFERKREKIGQMTTDGLIRSLEGDTLKKGGPELTKKRKPTEVKRSTLSFGHEDEEEQPQEEESVSPGEKSDDAEERMFPRKKKNLGKNPYVDTSFLPDKEREEKERELKRKFIEEYVRDQEVIKNQMIDTKYTYWDGLNNVKSLRVKKSTTVSAYLEMARKELSKEILDLRNANSEILMLVANDAIVPGNVSFYDLLVNKTESKYGPVLTLDKQEDNGEVVAGKPFKILDRRWFEKNKHIYPCNIWDYLDPNKIVPS